jgi:hypothetical protein
VPSRYEEKKLQSATPSRCGCCAAQQFDGESEKTLALMALVMVMKSGSGSWYWTGGTQMKRIESELRIRLAERPTSVTQAEISRKLKIHRTCLNLFENEERGISKPNIDKLLSYFGLELMLVPSDSSRTPAKRPQSPPAQAETQAIGDRGDVARIGGDGGGGSEPAGPSEGC